MASALRGRCERSIIGHVCEKERNRRHAPSSCHCGAAHVYTISTQCFRHRGCTRRSSCQRDASGLRLACRKCSRAEKACAPWVHARARTRLRLLVHLQCRRAVAWRAAPKRPMMSSTTRCSSSLNIDQRGAETHGYECALAKLERGTNASTTSRRTRVRASVLFPPLWACSVQGCGCIDRKMRGNMSR